MIDWVSAKLICNHDPKLLSSGIVASLDRDGNTEWLVNKRMSVEGSFSTKIQIQSLTDSQIIYRVIQLNFCKVTTFWD